MPEDDFRDFTEEVKSCVEDGKFDDSQAHVVMAAVANGGAQIIIIVT